MQSVTSNAVARDCLTVEVYNGSTTDGGGNFQIQKCGKLVTIDVSGMSVAQYAGTVVVTQLQEGFRPSRDIRVVGFSGSGSADNGNMIGFTISTNGYITTYPYVALQAGSNQLHATWII